MKASLVKRVERLKRDGNLVDLDTPASTPEPERVTSRCLDGVFTGTIQDGDGLRVHIARPLTLSRDSDGSWLAYSGEHAGNVAVCDPLACDALDAVFGLAANPDGVGSVTIREPEDD